MLQFVADPPFSTQCPSFTSTSVYVSVGHTRDFSTAHSLKKWQLRSIATWRPPGPTPCQSFWAVIGQICTAHTQKVPLPSFRSKFWQN